MAQEQQAVPVPIEPAMLAIKVDQFTDANNNKVIDAGESFAIRFTIENQGKEMPTMYGFAWLNSRAMISILTALVNWTVVILLPGSLRNTLSVI